MNEWMNEWVSQWVSEWVSQWVSQWVSESVSQWVSESVSQWVSEWVDNIYIYIYVVVSCWPSSHQMIYIYIYLSLSPLSLLLCLTQIDIITINTFFLWKTKYREIINVNKINFWGLEFLNIYIQVYKVSKTIVFVKFPAKYITIQLHRVKSLHPSRVSVGFRVWGIGMGR